MCVYILHIYTYKLYIERELYNHICACMVLFCFLMNIEGTPYFVKSCTTYLGVFGKLKESVDPDLISYVYLHVNMLKCILKYLYVLHICILECNLKCILKYTF